MSANPYPEYPDELKLSVWDKKKGSLPTGAEVGDKLKALQKKHDAIDWKQFDAGWTKAAKTAADLEQAFALRDRLYRGSVFALKKDALGVASAAKSLEKEKGAAKAVLDAAKAIGKAANGYADDIDKGIDELQSTFEKAKGALPKEDDEDEDSAPNLLLDPKRLLKQLKLCRSDPERRMNFAFIDGKGKEQLPVLALHPKMSSRKLFSTLQNATGVKTGAFGSAWVDGTSLMLQLDKPLGGLVKKVRGPVKACGFKIAKAVLWNEDGTVFEQDESADDGETAADQPAGDASEPSAAQTEFRTRWAALEPRYLQTLQKPTADASKLRAVCGFATGKAEAGQYAAALQGLDALEKLMAVTNAPPAPPGGPAAKLAAGPTAPVQSPEMTAFNARFAALTPNLKAAVAKGGEAGPALRLLASEAAMNARKQDFATANRMLDELQSRLATAGAEPDAAGAPAGPAGSAAPAAPAGSGAPRVAGATGANVLFVQSQLSWEQTRNTVQSELRRMEQAILDASAGEVDSSGIAARTQTLYKALGGRDQALRDKLDDAVMAKTPEEEAALKKEAHALIRETLAFVDTDPLMAVIDDNPFGSFDVKGRVTATLNELSARFA